MTEILSFILLILGLLCGIKFLISVSSRHDNTKEFSIRISFTKGIEVKSLFYKK